VDVIEFIAIAKAIGRDPLRLLKQFLQEEPGRRLSSPSIEDCATGDDSSAREDEEGGSGDGG
jgi:hypothetical protein